MARLRPFGYLEFMTDRRSRDPSAPRSCPRPIAPGRLIDSVAGRQLASSAPSMIARMVDDATPSLLDRTWGSLRRVWREVSSLLPGAINPTIDADLQGASAQQLRERMRECLEARGGEVSGRARAVDLGMTYLRLSAAGRKLFLSILAHDFDLSHDEGKAAAQAYLDAPSVEDQR